MMKKLGSLCAVATVMLAFGAPAFSAQSIVGSWDNEDCSRPMVIGQMSLQANDTICRFDTVKRKGNVVTWKGDCDGKKTTVRAELSGGRLSVDIAGFTFFNDLKRCGKKGGGDQDADAGESAPANGIPAFVKNGVRYNASLRQKLRNAGWDTEGANIRQDGDCDASIDDRCDTFSEALTCAPTGVGFCNMVWINDGRLITITTAGDDGSTMRVTRVKKGTP
jgi:hypothetical protein